MNGCKDNSMKYIPLYHHEQVPFQPFQDNSVSVKLTTPISTENNNINMNNNNINNNTNTNSNSNSNTYDLQDIIICYQSQPELLRLILSSKLEEDKRRAEEAKLKAKELDLLIIQQQQQLLSTSSSSSTSHTPALASPSTSSSSIHFASSSDISFSTSPPSISTSSSTSSSTTLVAHSNNNNTNSSPSPFSFQQPIHNNNNSNDHHHHHHNNNHIDDDDNSSLPFQYLNQPMANLMTSPTVSQKSNPFHLKLNLTNNNNNNNNNQDLINSYNSSSSTPLLNDPPHPLCSNDMNSSHFSTPNLISPISEITNQDMNTSSSTTQSNYINQHHQSSPLSNHQNNVRYDPYYQQQHRQKRKREMQAITKIVETREYPYIDGFSWRNNGNTIQKKTGNKSVYYKCANSVNGNCTVNKTILFKENGEYLIKYRGEHLPSCGKSRDY